MDPNIELIDPPNYNLLAFNTTVDYTGSKHYFNLLLTRFLRPDRFIKAISVFVKRMSESNMLESTDVFYSNLYCIKYIK